MNKDDIPDALVNKENFLGLINEARSYRKAYRIASLLALAGWLVVLFLQTKG